MSLSASSCASGIWEVLQGVAEMDSSGEPKTDSDGVPIPPDESTSSTNFASGFASEYDSYAQAGVVNAAALAGSSDPSILENFLKSSGEKSIPDFAQALADYWATSHLVLGTAVQLDVVVSVTNDASAHVADFEAAINASITQNESLPNFEVFISNVEAVVKTILWSITEQNTSTGSMTTYTMSIS